MMLYNNNTWGNSNIERTIVLVYPHIYEVWNIVPFYKISRRGVPFVVRPTHPPKWMIPKRRRNSRSNKNYYSGIIIIIIRIQPSRCRVTWPVLPFTPTPFLPSYWPYWPKRDRPWHNRNLVASSRPYHPSPTGARVVPWPGDRKWESHSSFITCRWNCNNCRGRCILRRPFRRRGSWVVVVVRIRPPRLDCRVPLSPWPVRRIPHPGSD